MNLQAPKVKEELLILKEKEIIITKKVLQNVIPADQIMRIPKRNDYAVIAKEMKRNVVLQISAEMTRVLTQFYTKKPCDCTIPTDSSMIQDSDLSYIHVCFKCLGKK